MGTVNSRPGRCRYRLIAAALATVGLFATACDENVDSADPPTRPLDELSEHGGEFCPWVLPRARQETYGFGTSAVAESAPSLWTPEEAWVCQYNPADIATPGTNGAWYEWERQGKPRQLNREELRTFAANLKELQPPEDSGGDCTSDLGSRYLVSYSHENDLTGIVIDTYGCDEIRLTDDPFTTVPGDATQPGTVAGVLYGPESLLDDLGVPQ